MKNAIEPPPQVHSFPECERIGRKLFHFKMLESTNDLARELASDPENDGVAVLADVQTHGRGQYGRVWQANPGGSLLCSVLLYPPQQLWRPAILTALAAVSVASTIEELIGLPCGIKWPNDLLLNGKKVCGILTESGAAPRSHAVVGIGLNLNQSEEEFAAQGLPDATSLFIRSGKHYAIQEVARLLLCQLDRRYSQLLAGEFDTLEREWCFKLRLLDREVQCEFHDGTSEVGTLQELSFTLLVLQDGSGGFRPIVPEYVRNIREVCRIA